MNQLQGRLRTRAALGGHLPDAERPRAVGLADLFAPELDEYAEIILGPGKSPIGFMTRGEGAGFTDHAQHALEQLGMPDAARRHHQALSDWFEHARAFLKLEWHLVGSAVEPLAACYFRRRPTVDETITRMAHLGIGAEARELAVDVAAALEKDTIHFVSAAFRPGREVHHKLYFSQWVQPGARDQLTERVARVFKLFGMSAEQEAHWRRNHGRCMSLVDSTLFVSISFSREGPSRSFKIDYPNIGAARAAMWLPADEQEQVIADAETGCELAGCGALSFLGVRFAPDRPLPSLKYYCDVPTPQPEFPG